MGPLLVYDADCGPCTRFRDAVGLLDPKREIRFVPLDEAEERGVLAGVPPGLRRRSFHLITPRGEVLSGANALPELARLLPCGPLTSRALGSCGPVSRTASFAYLALSRLHDNGGCAAGRNGPPP